MKICYLAPANSIHTTRWVNYFAKKGYEIHLVSFTPSLNELDPRVVVHLIPSEENSTDSGTSVTPGREESNRKPAPFISRIMDRAPVLARLMVLKKYLKVRRLINEIKPDIVHAHYLTVYGLLGVLANYHPIYISIWGSDLWIESRGLMKYISRYVVRKADGIHCDGQNVFDEIVTFEKKPDKIAIIHYGTDIEKFKPIIQDKNAKPSLGCSDCIAVISIRALEPIYDIATLINAIPEVVKNHPSARFFIAGKGSEENNLKSLAESLGIKENVHFIGNIPNDKLPLYFSESDIYVSTSLSDGGLAASTAEAMASELPVIITDFGDNSKWISDGVNGYLIPLKSPGALAERILYLINNPEKRLAVGRNARTLIAEDNNYYIEMEKVHTIYKKLAGRSQ